MFAFIPLGFDKFMPPIYLVQQWCNLRVWLVWFVSVGFVALNLEQIQT